MVSDFTTAPDGRARRCAAMRPGSMSQPLDADRFTPGVGRAVPLGTEPRVRPHLRTHDRGNGSGTQQRHGEQNAHDVCAGRIPMRPLHLMILARAAMGARVDLWRGSGAVNRRWFSPRAAIGRMSPRSATSSLMSLRKKAGRGWHHHSRALHRRSMGQGGRPAAGMTPEPPESFQASRYFFTHG